ncbi:MAG: TGS domain-containing protein [Caldilineaceae bacterium]|nr:TGS domain-containing protein [Caldilineaceae bacterium]
MASAVDSARQCIAAMVDQATVNAPRRYERFRSSNHHLVDSCQHGLAVADHLRAWNAPPELEAAGMLHSLHWNGWLTAEAIHNACGDRVAAICANYREILTTSPQGRIGGDPSVLRRARLYMAAYYDPLLALLGAADSWDHLSVAQQVEGNRRRRMIDEIEKATIPLFDMLGMGELKVAAEDWVMAHGPAQRDYHRLQERIAQTEALRSQTYAIVAAHLAESFPQAQLINHPHTPASLYQPHLPEKAHPEALQSLTVNAIVEEERDCYLLLHAIHSLWTPLDGSLVDHVGSSKLNGHRTLKTTVQVNAGSSLLRVDFHICTGEMDEINRWGLAAIHLRDQLQIDLPQAWWRQCAEGDAAIRSATMGDVSDPLYVFSPQGELFAMASGCSVVDYAYRVHSTLAHQCKQFLVNGVAVAPTTVLHHLDLLELVRDPLAPGPSQVWLEAAKTSRARNDIRRFLRRQGQGARHGQRMVEQDLQEMETLYGFGIPRHRLESTLESARRRLRLNRVEDLFTEVAAGRCNVKRMLHPLFAEEIVRQVQLPDGRRLHANQIRLARCCTPRTGEPIVGRPRYRGDVLIGIKVHRAGCAQLQESAPEEIVELGWRLRPPARTIRRLDVSALDEPGLLGAALTVIYNQHHMTLHKAEAESRYGQARMRFTVEADQDLIDQVERSLFALPNYRVDDVRQMQLLLSEWEDLAIPLTAVNTNPYSRLPVKDRDMLFGRREDLTRIQDLLTSGCALIMVRGQKRIGKTSLLLHLCDYRLLAPHFFPIFIDFQYFSRMDTSAGIFYEIASAVYNELQKAGRIGEIGAPLWHLFTQDAPRSLESYLRNVHTSLGGRLILLLDEFSTTIDAHDRGELAPRFFSQWRGLVQGVRDFASFVVVVQQVSYERVRHHHRDNPAWQLMEIGEPLFLRPLAEQEIADLIERPLRNYTRYTAAAIERIRQLTGGSPFLTQAFCYILVGTAGRQGISAIDVDAVESVAHQFLAPDENLFTHLLDLIHGLGDPVTRMLARLTDPNGDCVSIADLGRALPSIDADRLNAVLSNLIANDILIPCLANRGVRFASLLFARWLQANP